MNRFVFAVSLCLAGAAACAEQSNNMVTDARKERPSATHHLDKAAAQVLVREFSGDAGATVTTAKVSGEGVCGTAIIDGQPVKFYADLVDDEAFIEKRFPGAEAIISAAC